MTIRTRIIAAAVLTLVAAGVITDGEGAPAHAGAPVAGTHAIVSLDNAGQLAENGHESSGALAVTVSDDGALATFVSDSVNLPGGDSVTQAYVRHVLTDRTSTLSRRPDGAFGNGDTLGAALSGDGRWAVLVSESTNLVPGFDTHGLRQVYLREMLTGQIRPVSHVEDSPHEGADASVDLRATVSRDGRLVAFVTAAQLMPEVVTDGVPQVYVYDALADSLMHVSRSPDGTAADGVCAFPSISANGQYVAWESSAANLVPGTGSAERQVYRRDVSSMGSSVELVSVDAHGPLDRDANSPTVSDHGSVAFSMDYEIDRGSFEEPLSTAQVVLKDRAGSIRFVSHDLVVKTEPTLGVSVAPVISADGRTVVYQSDAVGLVHGTGSAPPAQVYRYSVSTGANSLVTVGWDGVLGSADSTRPYVAATSDSMAFVSEARNLVRGRLPGWPPHVYLFTGAARTD